MLPHKPRVSRALESKRRLNNASLRSQGSRACRFSTIAGDRSDIVVRGSSTEAVLRQSPSSLPFSCSVAVVSDETPLDYPGMKALMRHLEFSMSSQILGKRRDPLDFGSKLVAKVFMRAREQTSHRTRSRMEDFHDHPRTKVHTFVD